MFLLTLPKPPNIGKKPRKKIAAYLPATTFLIRFFKVHLTRKITHFKNTLKAFQSRVKWRFSFCDIFFCSRDIQVSCYANLVTDDVIGSAWVVRRKIKNISANWSNALDCSWNLAGMLHPTKYTRWCPFWCCYGNMLGSSLRWCPSFNYF